MQWILRIDATCDEFREISDGLGDGLVAQWIMRGRGQPYFAQ